MESVIPHQRQNLKSVLQRAKRIVFGLKQRNLVHLRIHVSRRNACRI